MSPSLERKTPHTKYQYSHVEYTLNRYLDQVKISDPPKHLSLAIEQVLQTEKGFPIVVGIRQTEKMKENKRLCR